MSQSGQPDGTKTGVGSVATDETKQDWKQAWDFYKTIRGPRADRISKVAEKFGVSRKGAKRRIKNYEAWQILQTGSLPDDPYRAETLALGNAMLLRKRTEKKRAGRPGFDNANSMRDRNNRPYRPQRPGFSRPTGERNGNTMGGNSSTGRGPRY